MRIRSYGLGLVVLGASLSLLVAASSASAARLQVTAGWMYSCAVLPSGHVDCWGVNNYGQLGDGEVGWAAGTYAPVEVQDIADATEVVAGQIQTCALLSTGHVDCWGGEANEVIPPAEVPGITDATQITMGGRFMCALLSSGHIDCWGHNESGELGDGSTTNSETPQEVQGITNATQVSAGDSHTCAVLSSGHVDCWGNNGEGQLGNEKTHGKTKNTDTPVEVLGLADAIRVAAAGASTCAVVVGGHVECWGANERGQLGDGNTKKSTTAVQVPAVADATGVAAAGDLTCVVLSTGHVDCWGYREPGPYGSGPFSSSDTPLEVPGIANATQVALGDFHSCAVLSTARIDCWGTNEEGQLGDGEQHSSRDTPVETWYITNATQVAAGSDQSCAVLSGGQADCWGNNSYGQLGDGDLANTDAPVRVQGVTSATQIAAGALSSCAALSSGRADCWGTNYYGALGDGTTTNSDSPVEVHGITNVTELATGWEFACAVLSSENVSCWGENESGQLGVGSSAGPDGCFYEVIGRKGEPGFERPCSTVPAEVRGISNATQVAAGGDHACAVLSTGHVACWGNNEYSALGDGPWSGPETCDARSPRKGGGVEVFEHGCSTTPVEAQGIANAIQVSVGASYSCALLATGHVECWGSANGGQLGDGFSSGPETCGRYQRTCSPVPVEVQSITNATQLAAGDGYACALLSTGQIDCWGDNGSGQLGDGNTTGTDTPVEVQGVTNAMEIAAGSGQTCAVISTGQVDCWGAGGEGQLGNGEPWAELPRKVLDIVSPPAVQTGSASAVTSSSARLTATVNPDEAEVTVCQFEYGTTSSYGSSVPCSSAPGSGGEGVQVTAAPSGLSADADYHFRISATSAEGTVYGADRTFTTLQSHESGETGEPAKPATAVDGGLSVQATGGTGAITIGRYGTKLGGPALAGAEGDYFQVDRGAGSSFTKIEYTDCELEGSRTLWWDDPATGWEPIAAPTAAYDDSTRCITVTATAGSRPSIGQLSDARHAAGPSALVEYGKCMATKRGRFEDPACTKESFKEARGVRSYKGSYEWRPAPSCHPQSHGRYADSACSKESYSEARKTHERKYSGSYEAGMDTFTGSGGSATIEAAGLEPIDCQASTAIGTQREPDEAAVQITFTGCTSEGAKCKSPDQGDGTILTEPLESYTYEEGSGYVEALAGSPITSFSCARGTLTLSGAAGSQLSVPINTPASSGISVFGAATGEHTLQLEDEHGAAYPATLTTVIQTAEAPIELRTNP